MMIKNTHIARIMLGVTLFMTTLLLWAQQTPAGNQKEAITITNATLHIGDGTVITNGNITFENGVITAIGLEVVPKGKIINSNGAHVYPGFIAPTKALGLVEINAVRASDDEDEIGEYIPHVRSLIAYNAESQVVESLRPNGVLIGQIAPQGGTVSGTSSIVQFDAWNWEDAAIKVDDGIHVHWPNSFRRGRWWQGESRGYRENEKYLEQTDQIKELIKNAMAYGLEKTTTTNQAFEAMQGLFRGTQRLFIYAHGEKEITDAVVISKNLGIDKVVIVGGYQAPRVINLLIENEVPVLVRHTHSLPFMDDDDYDYPYRLPKILAEAGVLVGIQNEEASNFQVRNLPFYAGQVVGQGLAKEEGLKLITSNTAKILGIDDNYGTLGIGKSATLFISEGDALDMIGNKLTHAFIDGRAISLATHQTELWHRYREKYLNK